jgi:hypothetical protein
MAVDTGTASFTSGTGTKTINIGMAATWMEVYFFGSGIKPSHGFIAGGTQYVSSDPNSSLTTGKAIQVRNTSGTIILEGTWTSFASNNVNFNITTAPATMPQMLLNFGN